MADDLRMTAECFRRMARNCNDCDGSDLDCIHVDQFFDPEFWAELEQTATGAGALLTARAKEAA